MHQLQAVRDVLRALADVRDGSFYELWLELTYVVKTPLPKIGFHIRRIADSKDAFAIVHVSLIRPDGVEVLWSVSVETTDKALIITGTVELETDEGTVQVYTNSHSLQDSADIVETIYTLAYHVCSERSWLMRRWPPD